MTSNELNLKIQNFATDIRSNITEFVKENAKYKVGDVIQSDLGIKGDVYYAVTEIGYKFDLSGEGEIVYFGTKLVKSTGEVSFMAMDSDIGTPERFIKKATLKVKKNEITFIEDHKYFHRDVKIKVLI